MKPAQRNVPSPPRQLMMVLDGKELRSMTVAERAAAVAALANLLLEAADISARKSLDDHG